MQPTMFTPVALASVNAGGTFAVQRGFIGIVHNGNGDDSLELPAPGIAALDLLVHLAILGAGDRVISYVRTDATHIQVLVQAAGVPANASFTIVVSRIEQP